MKGIHQSGRPIKGSRASLVDKTSAAGNRSYQFVGIPIIQIHCDGNFLPSHHNRLSRLGYGLAIAIHFHADVVNVLGSRRQFGLTNRRSVPVTVINWS